MKQVLENLEIKKATINDVNSIGSLLFGLKSQYGSCNEKDETTFIYNYKNSIHKAIISKSNFIWVAFINNEVVGFISYTRRHVLRLAADLVVMEELFVKKEYRRIGIALLLYNKSIETFLKLGVHNLEVVSSMAHSGQREWGKKIGLEWHSNIHRLTI